MTNEFTREPRDRRTDGRTNERRHERPDGSWRTESVSGGARGVRRTAKGDTATGTYNMRARACAPVRYARVVEVHLSAPSRHYLRGAVRAPRAALVTCRRRRNNNITTFARYANTRPGVEPRPRGRKRGDCPRPGKTLNPH